MKVSVSNKDILRLAAPISLSLIIPQVNFLTNTAFLGRLGEVELGVNGISGIFYLTLSMIGYGLNNGIQIQLARRAGEGDNEGLARTFTNGLMLSLLFALGMMVLSLWVAPLIFGLSLHNSENIFLSVKFIYIRVWGLPFLMFTQLFNAFYISIQKSKYLIYGSLTSTIVNILFDYLLIFGHAGFPHMGLEGAAVASVIGEFCGCLVMFAIFYFNRLYERFPLLSYLKFNTQLAGRMLKVSSPLIVQFLFSIGGWQVFFIFVEHLGTRELASSQILRSVFGIVGVGTWAFASTCNSMVSNVIGQKKQRVVLPLIIKVARLSFLYALIVCAILWIFSDAFLLLYRDDPSLAAFAKPSLHVIILGTLIMSLSTVVYNGVVGTGNTLVNLFIEMFCVGCYLVYCYFIIERNRMSLQWAWGSEFVYWTSLLLTCTLYIRSGKWKGKKI